MPKYTDEAGNIIDTGETSIQQLQEEAQRLRKHSETLLGEKKTEAQKRVEAEQRITTLVTELDVAKAESATAVEAVKAELSTSLTKATGIAEAYKAKALDLAVTTPVLDMANRLTIAPELAAPIIRSRVLAEADESGNVVVKVLDKAGKATDMSFDDLAKELATDDRLKPIIKKSGAKGGGFGPEHSSTGGAGGNKQLSAKERIAAARERHKQ